MLRVFCKRIVYFCAMELTKKRKSDLIFYSSLILLVLFLFFTPWGLKLRSWIGGVLLSAPSVEQTLPKDETTSIKNNWEFISQDGNTLLLSEIDQPIFLNIWATWCGPCRSEMQSIVDLHSKYGQKVLFILVSPSENLETIKKFKETNNIDMDLYVTQYLAPEVLQTNVFPTTFIISPDKHVILKSEGAHDWNAESVHEFLDKLLK